jgi:hypothetical protein
MDVVTPAPLTGPLAPRLRPDSHLVVAARDLLALHSASEADGWCLRCEQAYPCPPAVHAAQVCQAAGLDLPAEPAAPAQARRGLAA